jgi:putative transcriptional regulator
MKKKPTIAEKIIHGLETFAEALEQGEDITKRFTCHKVVLHLEPTSYSPELVRQTRNALNVSQSLFAQFLGVATNTVCAWERGDNSPNDMACRFMDEIRHNPDYWRKRFFEMVTEKTCS